jgi:hypothetical protein
VTHTGDPDFLAALDELRALHLAKGADYADLSDPLRNYVMSSQDCGVQPWRGAMLRLSEKYHRLTNLIAKDATPNFESLDDTLMDMAALALIVRSLRKRGVERLPLQRQENAAANPGPEIAKGVCDAVIHEDRQRCASTKQYAADVRESHAAIITHSPDATGDSISPEPWGDLF